MITAVVELPTVLDFHLAADAVPFAFVRRVGIWRAQHPEATIAVQAASHHEPVPRLEHVQCHRLSTSSTQAQMSCKGKTTEVSFITWPGRTLSAMNSGTTVGCNLISLISSRARSAV